MAIFNYLFQHKWLALICFLLLLGVTISLALQLNSETNPSSPKDSNISPTISSFNGFRDGKPEKFDKEDIIDPAKLKGLQKTEQIKDGKTLYTLSSSDPKRPNIIIVDKDGSYNLKRIAMPIKYPLSSFVKLYGRAKWIFKGSVFYGADVQQYIYADLGFALVANPQTDEVFEQYLFQPMKIDEYIKNYGDDIPTQP